MSEENEKFKPETFESALLKLKPVEGEVNFCVKCGTNYIEAAPANVEIECPKCGQTFRLLKVG